MSEDLLSLVEALARCQLHQQVASVARFVGSDAELLSTLNRAREARNRIAHELALSFERWIERLDLKLPERMLADLPSIIRPLAEGDRAVSMLASLVTHEPLPTAAFLEGYPTALVAWVCDMEES